MEKPRDIYVPIPKSLPVAACVPDDLHLRQFRARTSIAPSTSLGASPVPMASSEAPSITPPAASNPPAPIPASVCRELEHKGYQVPWRTRREAFALRDAPREFFHRHGLRSTLDHAALVSILATRESIDKAPRTYCSPKDLPDMPTAFPTSSHPMTSPISTSRPKQRFGDIQ